MIDSVIESKRRAFIIYLILWLVEGILLLGMFIAALSQKATAGVGGISTSSWAVILGFLTIILVVVVCLWQWIRNPRFAEQWMVRVHQLLSQEAAYSIILVGSGVLFILCVQLVGFVLAARGTLLAAYGDRLLHAILWIGLLALQTVIWLPIFRYGGWKIEVVQFRSHLRSGLVVLSILLALWGFVLATGIGLKPDLIGWYEPGAPLLSVQVFLAWALLVLFLLVLTALKPSLRVLDIVMMILLWAVAVWMWEAQPMRPNFFAPRPSPPTFEYFPYSDAVAYDLTSYRVGLGIKDPLLPSKPLYGYLLAGLRALHDGSYEDLVRLQIMVLALFPLLIYGIGATLHHRASGFFGALLIIFREANAIQLSGLIKVAHAKLLLSDLPTAVFLAFLLWVAARWLKTDNHSEKERSSYPAFVLGALAGFSLLLRPQMTLLIPMILAFILWVWRRRPLAMIKSATLMVSGALIALSGWFWYSWQHTSFLLLNDPWQTAYMTSVYHLSPDVVDVDVNRLPRRPGESLGEYDARVRRSVAEFTVQYPQIVAQFVSAHFFHNQIESLFALPVSPFWVYQVEPRLLARWHDQAPRLIEECCSVRAYVKQMVFWKDWEGELPPENLLPFCFNLAMTALGIGTSWQRQRTLTVFALLLNMVYLLSSAMGRQSGWRFMLPVDWLIVLFFAIGVAELTFWCLSAFYRLPNFQDILDSSSENYKPLICLSPNKMRLSQGLRWGVTLFIIVLISWSFNLAEWLVKPRYPLKDNAQISAGWIASAKQWLLNQGIAVQDERSWDESGWIAVEGKALYPRYLRAHQEDVYPPWAVKYLPDENRLVFFLLGAQERWVAIGLSKPPDEMEQGAEVILAGCPRAGFLEASIIQLQSKKNKQPVLIMTDRPLEPCPSP